MKIVIIEDEHLAAKKITKYIEKVEPSASIVAVLNSISKVVEWFQNNDEPDLIFSDIEILEGNVFSAYEQYLPSCPIIFTTAYDNFVLEAFQNSGIEYLLKPFDEKRFTEAFLKYRRLKKQMSGINDHLVEQIKASFSEPDTNYKKRFTIKRHKGIELLDCKDIALIKLDQTGLFAHDIKGNFYPFHDNTVSGFESQLDPKYFFRINRNEIVNIEFIELIKSHTKDKLKIELTDLDFECYTSSHKTPSFRKWIEGE